MGISGDAEGLIDEDIKMHEDVIRKETNVQQSGEQLMIRFPRQIAELLNIKKGNKFEFEVNTKTGAYKIRKK